MDWLSCIGWVANIFIITGSTTVGYKYRHAFLLTIVGDILWFLKSYHRSNWDLAFLCGVFIIISGRNWWLWNKEHFRKDTKCLKADIAS